jgi:hypothetical protein
MILYALYVCLLHSCFIENHSIDLEAMNPSFLSGSVIVAIELGCA